MSERKNTLEKVDRKFKENSEELQEGSERLERIESLLQSKAGSVAPVLP